MMAADRGEEAENPVEIETGQHIRVLIDKLRGIVDFIVHNEVEILIHPIRCNQP